MHQQLIQRIVEEIRANLTGRVLGRVFQLSPLSFALDFGQRARFLFISVDPSSPRLYLIQRRVKELERQALQLSHFGQALRSKLGRGQLISIDKDPLDRVVRLSFRIDDELGATHFRRLVIQLTGRAANLFLLDELNRIVAALRRPKRGTDILVWHAATERSRQAGMPVLPGIGQEPGEVYLPPPTREKESRETPLTLSGSPSAHADASSAVADAAKAFDSQANNLRSRLRKSISHKRKMRENLQKDLVDHGDPEEHKMTGDLLLANVATAQRDGNKVRITNYYAEDSPMIELEIDENTSLQDEAARRFRQYTKAKRAGEEIAVRVSLLDREITQLENRDQELATIIHLRDETALWSFDNAAPAAKRLQTKSAPKSKNIPGVRRYLSTDGYEILVGRAARDNDHLTFRLAQPNDLWMHAGDYPGSHVVVRNPTRKEIPHRTIIEAAQLAGRFSQASADSKVVVHYTLRKFLSKPKRTAPGLVRMSSFRSITVEPKESVARVRH